MHDPQDPQRPEGSGEQTPAAPPAGGTQDGTVAGGGGEAQAPTQAQDVADAGGAGDGGGGGDDTPPAAPPAPPVTQPEDEDADDEDPRLTAARPTFTREHAFQRALVVMASDGTLLPKEDREPLRLVFDRIGKIGSMAPETAWRTVAAKSERLWPAWDTSNTVGVVNMTLFVAVAAALIPIADAQQAAFEKVQAALKAEARLSGMNRARARRREKKAARLAKRPDAVRKYLANKARNAETRQPGTPAARAAALKAEKAKPPAPPPPAPAKSGSRKKGGK